MLLAQGSSQYFLFEYEEFLKNKAKETNDKITIDNFLKTTIEHVIPQDFQDNWNDTVQSIVKPLTDKNAIIQTHKVLINTLGNLTILKNDKNTSLGNKGWEKKQERYKTGSYNEIDISRSHAWGKSNLADRGLAMLRFLETKVSGLTFTEDDIKEILFYDKYIIDLIYDRSPS